jgi:hypothetical protein
MAQTGGSAKEIADRKSHALELEKMINSLGTTKKTGENTTDQSGSTSALNCAAAPEAFQKACPFGDGVTDNDDKGNEPTGPNKKTNGNTSGGLQNPED